MAARYEEWYLGEGARVDRLEKAVLRKLLGQFPNARSVLDVGCGTGHFSRWFARRGLTTIGLDISASMLAEAQRHGFESCLQASACALPFGAKSFDLVAMIVTLEFLVEPARALEEAVRVARRGILVGILNRWSLYALRRRLTSSPVWRHARFFGPYEVRSLLTGVAGRRSGDVWWSSTSWSLPFHGKPLAVPYGDFIGLALRLTDDE